MENSLFLWIPILLTIWISFDSSKLMKNIPKDDLKKMGGLSSPLWWGVLTFCIWIVGLPWYLSKRSKYKNFDRNKIRQEKVVAPSSRINEDEIIQSKKCPFCAEEIKVDAIKCKHCGSDLEPKIQEKKQSGISLSNLITLGFVGAGVVVTLVMFSNDSSQVNTNTTKTQTSSISEKDKTEMKKAMQDLMKVGIVKKTVPSLSQIFVDRLSWERTTYDDKMTMVYIFGRYCGYEKNENVFRAEVLDHRSGKRLAKWSETFGLTVE